LFPPCKKIKIIHREKRRRTTGGKTLIIRSVFKYLKSYLIHFPLFPPCKKTINISIQGERNED
jgi:hypothetical protein